MKKDAYIMTSGTIFLVVALLHGWRALNGWNLDVGPWSFPVWFSWVVFAVLLYLAYSAYSLRRK